MNDYSGRARIYRQEFVARDDFELLRKILAGKDGLVIDAPAGTGRLLEVHAEHHRRVILVDLEPTMVAQCKQQITARNLSSRVSAVQGDIRKWLPPQPASRIVIARGGLQVLPSQEAMAEAVRRSAANLDREGVLYIDVALPWALSAATFHDLPVFMRFSDTSELRGHTLIWLNDEVSVRRSYRSVMYADRVVVDFEYTLIGVQHESWRDFVARTSWARLQPGHLRNWLTKQGLKIKATYGDYTEVPYTAQSSRFICMAVR
jgi:SAM-dependent methyltransferase